MFFWRSYLLCVFLYQHISIIKLINYSNYFFMFLNLFIFWIWTHIDIWNYSLVAPGGLSKVITGVLLIISWGIHNSLW